ncbi:MAG: hypothetical protein JOZ37_16055 [Actinobacteria bacterium]|nr:hypothetical protein [Actinomycetota bacterium]
MGAFYYLIVKSLVDGDASGTITNDNDRPNAAPLPAFVFGDDGEFLGRVDVPAFAGHKEVA